ncbi:MAG: hypothetical protein PWP23_2251 [Candidatus Sumerlaeota bacterium]|nr:hypothetical protein [Candidatus Sumerlaeota bacterium]
MTAFGRLLARLLFLLPLALCALAGCAGSSTPTAEPGTGKIPIRYQVPEDTPAGLRFHVYRAESASGPFERITAKPVSLPSRKSSKIVTLHVDRGLPLGATYYYYLESVDSTGRTAKVTEVAPARVLLPLQPEDPKASPPAEVPVPPAGK